MNSITVRTFICKISSLYNLNPPFPNKNCQNKYWINVVPNLSEESETLSLRLHGSRLAYAVSSCGGLRASLTAAASTVSLLSGTLRKASLSRTAITKVNPGTHTDRNSGEGLTDETTWTTETWSRSCDNHFHIWQCFLGSEEWTLNPMNLSVTLED
jgi:hypothetical protein